jgi:hypothetical protein
VVTLATRQHSPDWDLRAKDASTSMLKNDTWSSGANTLVEGDKERAQGTER